MYPVRTVLQIDLDTPYASEVRRALADNNVQVELLTEPDDWFQVLKEGNVRVVLLNIDMRRNSGLETLRDIKRFDNGILVVALSSAIHITTVISSQGAGAEYCLFTPLSDVTVMIDVVRHMFEKLDRWHDVALAAAAAMRDVDDFMNPYPMHSDSHSRGHNDDFATNTTH